MPRAIIWNNGNAMVFADDGTQMPTLQGAITDVAPRLRATIPEHHWAYRIWPGTRHATPEWLSGRARELARIEALPQRVARSRARHEAHLGLQHSCNDI